VGRLSLGLCLSVCVGVGRSSARVTQESERGISTISRKPLCLLLQYLRLGYKPTFKAEGTIIERVQHAVGLRNRAARGTPEPGRKETGRSPAETDRVRELASYSVKVCASGWNASLTVTRRVHGGGAPARARATVSGSERVDA